MDDIYGDLSLDGQDVIKDVDTDDHTDENVFDMYAPEKPLPAAVLDTDVKLATIDSTTSEKLETALAAVETGSEEPSTEIVAGSGIEFNILEYLVLAHHSSVN